MGLILEENELANFIKEVLSEPKEDEAKEKYKKYMIKSKRIIADSIKDHLIPQVSSKDTPKRCLMPYQKCMKEETSTGR